MQIEWEILDNLNIQQIISAVTVSGLPTSVGFSQKNRGLSFGSVFGSSSLSTHFSSVNSVTY